MRFFVAASSLALALGLLSAPTSAQVALDPAPIAAAIKHLHDDVRGLGGSLGAVAVDLDTGKVLAAHDEHAVKNPASNAKLFTAACALKVLGPAHRFTTGLYGHIKAGAIDELVLRGDGDPTLSTTDLTAMARELKQLGVKRVKAVLVDQSAFDDRYVPPAFDQQPKEWAAFRAPVAPVSLDENTVTLVVRPATTAGEPAIVSFEPPGVVDIAGAIKTTAKGAEKVAFSLEPKGGRLAAKLSGSIPMSSSIVKRARRVDDPRLVAGLALRSLLQEIGVEVGEVRAGGETAKALILSRRSEPLAHLLASLGKDSDNFAAEMIFKSLGAARDKAANATDAAAAVTTFLKGARAWEDGMMIKNGSGLFDANRVSAFATTTLLRAAFADASIGHEYVAQLAIGGVDGTLKHRFGDFATSRSVRAKTGTLDAVAALSGYVLAPPGKHGVAFSLYIEGISGKVSKARPALDRTVDAIAREVAR
jgi:D-alanyl-D-alanine carboxypeptidase/D-alanyl-D-alanine-endopeptidase (penicillin-binding protein 4)